MARLFIVSINYAPEPTGFAPHAATLAEYLADRGHDVSVFTGFPFAPHWRREGTEWRSFVATEEMRQVRVHRLSHFVPRRPSDAVQRIMMELTFGAVALVAMVWRVVRRDGRPDAVLYIGAQPTLAMLARIVAGVARCPYFVNINDLAAQAAVDVGIVRSGWLRRALESFEFSAYKAAAGATVLCGSFREALIEHRYPAERIHLIRSPIDLDMVRPVPRDDDFRHRVGIPASAFVIMYAGSMGRKQGLLNVIEAADLLRVPDLSWVLVGDGEMREELVEATRRRGLEHGVRFLPFQPPDDVSRMFGAADALLLNQVSAVKDSVIPSKLLTYMAAGKPVLAAVNARSQGAEILRESSGGLIVPPDDPHTLAQGARQMMALGERAREEAGLRNRAYAEQHFDQRKILAAHEQLILSSLKGRSRPAAPRADCEARSTWRKL